MTREEAIEILESQKNEHYKEELNEALDMAISALSEELSEDGTLTVHVSDGSKVKRVFVMGDNIFGGLYYPDSAENKGEWIPVSERLPEEDNEVLITIKSCGKWYVCHSVYRDGLFWQKNFEYNSYRNPIAWMPLPEPYKAEKGGE